MPLEPLGRSPILNSDFNLDSRTGQFISEKHRVIAQIISDYNPQLHVTWIPHGERTMEDKGKEFCIIHTKTDGSQYPVMFVADEEMDERVLGRLYDMDSNSTDPNKRLAFLDQVAHARRLREELNRREEAQEMVVDVLKSPKHTYTMPSGRKINK